ncbi:hypothetical protein Tco_0107822 [Tanacetum coccineum]
MMMCKQAEQGVQLQADWLEDTDEEIDEQELEAHYSFMAKIQEVLPEESNSTDQPLEQVDERSPVVKWEVSRFEQVPIQVSRQVTPFVQNTQEVYEEGRLLLDYRSRRSFHAAQAAYNSTSHASRTPRS